MKKIIPFLVLITLLSSSASAGDELTYATGVFSSGDQFEWTMSRTYTFSNGTTVTGGAPLNDGEGHLLYTAVGMRLELSADIGGLNTSAAKEYMSGSYVLENGSVVSSPLISENVSSMAILPIFNVSGNLFYQLIETKGNNYTTGSGNFTSTVHQEILNDTTYVYQMSSEFLGVNLAVTERREVRSGILLESNFTIAAGTTTSTLLIKIKDYTPSVYSRATTVEGDPLVGFLAPLALIPLLRRRK